jgi:1-acyl-sn-glycerol-3-phosphate acyltransferase
LSSVIERDLGVEMAGATLLGGFTIRGLASEVLGRMQLSQGAPTRADDTNTRTPTPASVPTSAPTPAPAAAPMGDSFADVSNDSQAVPPVVAPLPTADAPTAVDYRGLDYSRWSPSQRVVRRVFTAAFACVARVDAGGLEHIPRDGACLIAVNHLSMVDVPLMLTLLPRRVIILATDRLKQFRILDWFVSDMGQAIYVARGHAEGESLQRARAVLDSGGVLALAPEGTRSRTGLLRGQTGVAYLATQTGVPVVPVVAWGQEHWRTGWKRGRLPIVVRAGAPLRFPAGPASPADLRRYTDDVMARMAELLPPEYHGAYGAADTVPDVPADGTGGRS